MHTFFSGIRQWQNFLKSLNQLLDSNKVVGGNSSNQLPENLGISSEKNAKAQGKE